MSKISGFIFIAVASFAITYGALCVRSSVLDGRLSVMNECIADGHKRYECQVMLNSN